MKSYPYLKPRVSWHEKYIIDPLSAPIVELVTSWRWLTPTAITLASFGFSIVAIWCFSRGNAGYLILGALVWEFAHVLDGADGKLARQRNQVSIFGQWLDINLDRLKKALAFAVFITISPWDPIVTALLIATHYSLFHWSIDVNPRLKGALHARGIKRLFDPLDALLVVFVLGPIFSLINEFLLLAIACQIAERGAHSLANKLCKS